MEGDSTDSKEEADPDWEAHVVSEHTLDNLTTMLTIYPKYVIKTAVTRALTLLLPIYFPTIDHRVSPGVGSSVLDSHPRRTNGFLTGCLLNLLADDGSSTSLEDLPSLLADEMHAEASRAQPFRGASCDADVVIAGGDIWAEGLFEQTQFA